MHLLSVGKRYLIPVGNRYPIPAGAIGEFLQGGLTAFPTHLFIGTGGVMGPRPTQGEKNARRVRASRSAEKVTLDEGHGFSRAVSGYERMRALAPEVRLFLAFQRSP